MRSVERVVTLALALVLLVVLLRPYRAVILHGLSQTFYAAASGFGGTGIELEHAANEAARGLS
jgi:hypothetical protein